MNTSLERIRAKIAELDAKASDLRIAERELLALENELEKPKSASVARKPKQRADAEPIVAQMARGDDSAQDAQPEARQSIASAITGVLSANGSMAAAQIAEQLKASGRDITNRTVSFSLQGLKKRRLVKSADGEWTLLKARAK